MPHLLNKKELRQHFRNQRRAITPHEREQAAHAAAELLCSQPIFQQSQHVACYLPHQEEFDTLHIIQKIWDSQKYCYLPIISEKQLLFSRYQQNDRLHPNQYNIFEPDRIDLISSEKLDLVILPLVAFDLQGHRLGMGAGFYDKTFAFLREKAGKPYFLGLAYSVQQAEALPFDTWDVKLDGVLTEKEMLHIASEF